MEGERPRGNSQQKTAVAGIHLEPSDLPVLQLQADEGGASSFSGSGGFQHVFLHPGGQKLRLASIVPRPGEAGVPPLARSVEIPDLNSFTNCFFPWSAWSVNCAAT